MNPVFARNAMMLACNAKKMRCVERQRWVRVTSQPSKDGWKLARALKPWRMGRKLFSAGTANSEKRPVILSSSTLRSLTLMPAESQHAHKSKQYSRKETRCIVT